MNLLAFDTACDACSVALWRDGAVVARRARAMARGHAEALAPMIELTMRDAATAFADLTAVAVTVGPGAFTGLRIALATARAMALAAERPAIGVTTFEAIAAAAVRIAAGERRNPNAAGEQRNLTVAIETKRDDLYIQSFALGGSGLGFTSIGEPAALAAGAARPLLPAGPLWLAGDGAQRLSAALDAAVPHAILTEAALPDAADVAAIAAHRLAAGASLMPLRPLYLRPPAVRLPAGAAVIGSPS